MMTDQKYGTPLFLTYMKPIILNQIIGSTFGTMPIISVVNIPSCPFCKSSKTMAIAGIDAILGCLDCGNIVQLDKQYLDEMKSE